VGGRALYEWAVEALREVCARVVVAVPASCRPPAASRQGVDLVPGGATRAESVRAAVAAAPEASVYVVHDAARPLVTPGLVSRCLEALDGVDCAFAAARVTDTIHEGDELVERTLDRSRLWAAQTPQVARADVLRRALAGEGTDEASLVLAAGGTARAVEVAGQNLKITTALDLRLAEVLLAD
jgi:2-C-methyl-D-erythritol 4-phosphate cytidylyltransferase